MNTFIILGVIFLYLAFMLGIGVYCNKKSIKTSEDYLVAGRRLPWWLLVGCLAATEIGAGSTMGVAQKAYGNWGMSSIWYIWTMGISFLFVAFVAPRLRSSEVVTIPEFFLKKYGKINHLITSIIMFVPLIGLTAVQMIATAMIFSVVTGMDYNLSVVISCGIIIIYTVLGGMWSVSITDFWQFIIIVIGMVAALAYAVFSCGGLSDMTTHIPVDKLSIFKGMGVQGIVSLIIIYLTSMLIGQEVTQRLFSAKDKFNIVLGTTMTSLFYFLFAFIPPLIGLSIYALEKKGFIDTGLINNFADMYTLPIIALSIMPPFLTGLLFAGLISATMSSASSDLLGAASILSNDIISCYFLKKELADHNKILLIRILVAVIGLISLIIAIMNPADIIKLLMFSFSLRAAGSFFPYIIGHYTNKITNLATLMSLLSGSIILLVFNAKDIKLFGFEPIIPALLVSLFVTILFSCFPNNTGQKVSES